MSSGVMCGIKQGLVADAIGRGDRRRARELSVRLLKWGVALGGVLAALYAALEALSGDVLVNFFTEDATIAHKVGLFSTTAVMLPPTTHCGWGLVGYR